MMTNRSPRGFVSVMHQDNLTSRRATWLPLAFLWLVSACSHVVYQPTPVVPTKSPLPYSAKVRLVNIESYLVEPGATMIADPRLENRVTGVGLPLSSSRKEWEKSVGDYLVDRKTFTYLSTDSQTDVDMSLRLNIYIDPSVQWKFNHVYVARAEAAFVNPRSGRLLNYLGYGKAAGDVSRGGAGDDRDPMNEAVQSALNDLFGKMEQDARLRDKRQAGRLARD